MDIKPPPQSDHDAINQIWYAVVGTNGEGLLARVKRLEERGRNRWLVLKDICLLIVAVGSMVAAFMAVRMGG